METSKTEAPAVTIVRKVKKIQEGGHHGGSWKVAYADFVTAMMAFFLLMWILEVTSPEQRAGIADYFRQPSPVQGPGGASASLIDLGGGAEALPPLESPTLGGRGSSDAPPVTAEEECSPHDTSNAHMQAAQALENKAVDETAERLRLMLRDHPKLADYQSQVLVDVTDLGLRIQLVDRTSSPLFDLGSPEPKPFMIELLSLLAEAVRELPNRISIGGHTEALPFRRHKRDVPAPQYSNWELSSDRAHAARRYLSMGGIAKDRIVRVEGFAAALPFDDADTENAVNRRISILLLNSHAERLLGFSP
jgi:chemotaxis protein MotB